MESDIIEAKDERTVVPVDEKMLVHAIRQVVQEEIKVETAGLKVEMSDLMDAKLADSEVRMADLMDAKLAANNKALKIEIMEAFNTVLEEKVSKEIRLIAEQHGDLVQKQQELQQVDERTADLEDRVQVIEVVVQKHTGEIQELQRA